MRRRIRGLMRPQGIVGSYPRNGYEAGQGFDSWQDALAGLTRTVSFALGHNDPRLCFVDDDYFLFVHEENPGFSKGFAVGKADGRIYQWRFPAVEAKSE